MRNIQRLHTSESHKPYETVSALLRLPLGCLFIKPIATTMSSGTPPPLLKGQRRNQRQPTDFAATHSKRKSLSQSFLVSNTSLATGRFQQGSQQIALNEGQHLSEASDLDLDSNDGPPPSGATATNDTKDVFTTAVCSELGNPKTGKTPRTRVKSQRTSSSPLVRTEAAAVRPVSQSNSTIPSQASATPVKVAYAGPTFHASPAPSALPMPSFFSKSVPEVNNGKAPQALEDEGSPGRSGENHLKENAQIVDHPAIREESPLDIFFKADRDEKAERRKSSAPSLQSGRMISSPLRPFLTPVSSSKSLSDPKGRHHLRNPTDDSTGGIFALEMEGSHRAISPAFATPYKHRMDAVRANTAPSATITQSDHEEEQRKAKTKALKELLLTPQRPASASTAATDSSTELSFTTMPYTASPSIRTGNSPRYVSGPPTPAPALNPPWGAKHSQHHASHPSLGQSPGVAMANGSPRARHTSSTLRQEVTAGLLPHRGELKDTSVLSNSNSLMVSQDSVNTHVNGKLSAPVSAPNSSIATESRAASEASTSRNSNDVRSMEDDLRRILKLDILGNTGVNGTGNGVLGS